jgi:hypothetical protein
MANNKFYGYTPKNTKPSGKEGTIYSGEEKGNTHEHLGDRLDRVNPYEFRKGMDYELSAIGCSRLAESTPEERESATKKVLDNLENTPNHYTSKITYETLFRNVKGTKPSYTAWLRTEEDLRMKEVNLKFENDKMKEIKEGIKKTIKRKITESKVKEQEEDIPQDIDIDDDTAADKAATKGAKKSKVNRFDKEREAIEDLLYYGNKGKDGEFNKDNPAPKTIYAKKDELLNTYKTKFKGKGQEGVDRYNELLVKENEKFLKTLEKFIKKFGADGMGNNVTLDKVYAKQVNKPNYSGKGRLSDTIQLLGQRLKEIEKEEIEDVTAAEGLRKEIASSDMTREQHIKLLEICKEYGVNLREGAMGVKTYYEIAKAAYLEGVANGMRI